MRGRAALDPFIGEYLFGRARSEILRTLLQSPSRSWSVREVQVRSGISPFAVRQELKALSELGLLTSMRPVRGPFQYRIVELHPGIRAIGELLPREGGAGIQPGKPGH
jgi:DNA-binding transcriptional ArsR family regulator